MLTWYGRALALLSLFTIVGFYNPRPASAAGTQRLDPRSYATARSVDLHSQERQTPQPTSYLVNHFRFAEASVACARTRLPLSKIENNQLLSLILSNAL